MARESNPVTLPFPPSVNRMWRTFQGRMIISKEGRAFRKAAALAVAASGAEGVGGSECRVTIAAFFPDKRRRDVDNLLKGCLDSLVASGLMLDDSQITDLRIYRAGYDKARPRVEVTITPLGE